MTNLPAPRRAERLLESLGADTEFSDDVIGDLAEEFEIRAMADGVGAARRWYYRESLRVAPYLVRDWWRGLRANDIGRLAATICFSGAALMAFDVATRLAWFTVDPGLVSLWKALHARGDGWVLVFPAIMLLWTVVDGMVGGYVAARVGRRAPLASALALAVVSAVIMVVEDVLSPSSWIVLPFRVLNVMAIVGGVLAGGMLSASRGARRADVHRPDASSNAG